MAEDYTQRLLYLARTLSHALSKQLERALRPLELTFAQLSALAQLGRTPSVGMSGAALANGAGVSAQSMSTALKLLLSRELISRTPHPTHGRVLEVRITASGLRLLERAQAATAAAETRTLNGLTQQQRDQLKSLLTLSLTALGIDEAGDRPPFN